MSLTLDTPQIPHLEKKNLVKVVWTTQPCLLILPSSQTCFQTTQSDWITPADVFGSPLSGMIQVSYTASALPLIIYCNLQFGWLGSRHVRFHLSYDREL